MNKVAYWIKTANDITPEWVLLLNIPKRKNPNINPVDQKVLLGLWELAGEIENLKTKRFSEEELKFKKILFDQKLKQLRLSKEDIQNTLSKQEANIVKKTIGTYIKFDTRSYKDFLNNINIVESFLESLTGYHRQAANNIKVKFVGSTDIKSKAKYKTDQDTIYINSSKVRPSNEYAGLNYVVLHELGHRYLKKHPQSWDYDSPEWITTKYSQTDSMTGEEKFAELFAMSNWKSKYGQFADKIKKFEEKLQ